MKIFNRYCLLCIYKTHIVVFVHLATTVHSNDDYSIGSSTTVTVAEASTSTPFDYIGDIDPTKPLPWPKEEEDWWNFHDLLVQRVKASDAFPTTTTIHMSHGKDGENSDGEDATTSTSYLPQLVFFGDSITEGWNGTSFGNSPSSFRMWSSNEPTLIRETFNKHFGSNSEWGKRALRPPLILGISGSKTYDFIWRIENGEFPTSRLIESDYEVGGGEETNSSFELNRLERIYIVLMGTNNLGGGMLPEPTVQGMDAVGRKILQLHQESSPGTPAAILFSELLPRQDDHRATKMCPPRCKDLETLEPYTSFMPAIDKVNRALPGVLGGWRADYPNSKIVLLSAQKEEDGLGESEHEDSITTIRCGKEMFAIDNDDEFHSYMPDGLHPNAKGYDLWARCLKRGLEVIMEDTINLLR